MEMETPLAPSRGLGSAEAGAEHWWTERLIAAAALVLYVWLIASVLRLPDLDYGTVREWLAQPVAAVPMLLLVIVTFWHLKLGLQVVIEDYVHDSGSKFFLLLLVNFGAVAGAAFALFSILKIALTAGAAAAGGPPAGPF